MSKWPGVVPAGRDRTLPRIVRYGLRYCVGVRRGNRVPETSGFKKTVRLRPVVPRIKRAFHHLSFMRIGRHHTSVYEFQRGWPEFKNRTVDTVDTNALSDKCYAGQDVPENRLAQVTSNHTVNGSVVANGERP